MNHEEFKTVLQSAIAGNKEGIEKVLQIYAPLIDANSFFHGKFDEDLRQHILIHIIKNISKFKI